MHLKLSEGRLNRPAVRNIERKEQRNVETSNRGAINMFSGGGPTAERRDLEWMFFLQNTYCWKARVRGSC